MTGYIVAAAAIAIVLVQTVVIIRMRRTAKLNRELLAAMPLRFFVADRAGRLRVFRTGGAARRGPGGVVDFPGIDGRRVLARCRAVLHAGTGDGSEYSGGEIIRPLCGGRLAAWIAADSQFNAFSGELSTVRRRRAFEVSDDAVVFVDDAGRAVDGNNAFGRLAGYYPSELPGLPVENILRFREHHDWSWRSPAAVEFDDVLTSRDGEAVEVNCRTFPCRRCGETMVVLSDRRKESALRRQAEFNENILDQISSWCDLSYFCFSPAKGRITVIGRHLSKLWMFNGKFPVQPEEWICSADLPEFMRLRNAISTGAMDKTECTFRSDYFEDLRHYRIRGVAGTGPDGGRVVFGLLRNETQSARKERELRDANELIQAFLDAAPVPLFVKDVTDNFRYTLCNREFCREFGSEMDQIIGRSDGELYSGETAELCLASDIEADRAAGVMQFTELIRHADGRERIYRVFKKAFNSSGGKRMLAGAVLDMTDIETARKQEAEQRELLKKVLEHLPAFVAAKDASNDFRYTLWNRTAERMSGCSAAEVIGKTDFEIERFAHVAELLRREDKNTMADGARSTLRRVAGVGGAMAALQTSARPVAVGRDTNWVLITGLDVTEREAMAAEREKLIRDLDGHVMAERIINRCLRQISGEFDFERSLRDMLRVIGEAAGADCCHIHEFTADGVFCNLLCEWIKPGIDLPAIYRQPNLPREVFADIADMLRQERVIRVTDVDKLSATQTRLRDDMRGRGLRGILHVGIFTGDQLTGVIGIDSISGGADFGDRSLDILQDAVSLYRLAEERKRRLDELERSRELLARAARQAENAATEKSMFLATMSHELRTPLNAVIGFAELLEPGCGDPAVTLESVRAIKLAGTTLLDLINDILDLSKLESGKMQLRRTPTSVAATVEDIMTMFEVKLREKRIYGRIDISGIPPCVFLDGLRLRQILLNLVGNAVKFTHSGGITVRVRFDGSAIETGILKIEVGDTGIGIAASDLENIFDPFVQSGAVEGQGTGLGLPICRRLAEQMGGRLHAASTPGSGSAFTLELPGLCFSSEVVPESEPEPAAPEAGIRVLAVDDQELNRKLLAGLCGRLNLDVRTAASGGEALEMLETFAAEVVLTDLRMPDMAGDELARRIRRRPGGSGIKLAMVTADVDAPGSEAAKGFDVVLVKPVTLARLSAFFAETRGWEGGGECTSGK